MKKKLKQFLCWHLYQDIGDPIFLRKAKERWDFATYYTFKYYGQKVKCLKCEYETYEERRILLI